MDETAEWKEWHVGDAVTGKVIDQGVVGPRRQL